MQASTQTHLYHLPQPDRFPDILLAVIEIPAGSPIKYEIDAESGRLFVDRFLSMPVHYPAHYGSLPSITAADGDPVDVLIFARAAIAPGTLIEVRPIGVLNMRDGEEADDKIIAVPAADVDPYFSDTRNIDDLSLQQRQSLEEFFRIYKNLPRGHNNVTTQGFDNVEEARKRLLELHKNPQ